MCIILFRQSAKNEFVPFADCIVLRKYCKIQLSDFGFPLCLRILLFAEILTAAERYFFTAKNSLYVSFVCKNKSARKRFVCSEIHNNMKPKNILLKNKFIYVIINIDGVAVVCICFANTEKFMP